MFNLYKHLHNVFALKLNQAFMYINIFVILPKRKKKYTTYAPFPNMTTNILTASHHYRMQLFIQVYNV